MTFQPTDYPDVLVPVSGTNRYLRRIKCGDDTLWVKKWRLTVNAGTGGTVNVATGDKVDGSTIQLTATPSSGYRFVQWTYTNSLPQKYKANDASATERSTFTKNGSSLSVLIKEDVTVSAEFELYNHTVRFYSEGTLLKTQVVQHGGAATAPGNPTKTGYTFTGWDKDFSNVTQDLDVYANFTINTYTVRFFASSTASSPLETKYVPYGSTDYLYSIPPVDGWTSIGWNKRSATGNSYGQPVTDNVDYSPEYRRTFSGQVKTGTGGTASASASHLSIPKGTMGNQFIISLLDASGSITHEASPDHKAVFGIYLSTLVGTTTLRSNMLTSNMLSTSNEMMNFSLSNGVFSHDWRTYDNADTVDLDCPVTTLSNSLEFSCGIWKQGGCVVAWTMDISGTLRLM